MMRVKKILKSNTVEAITSRQRTPGQLGTQLEQWTGLRQNEKKDQKNNELKKKKDALKLVQHEGLQNIRDTKLAYKKTK